MSEGTYTIKKIIYDITNENVVDKMSEHFADIINHIKIYKIKNVKVTTKIEHATEQAFISSELIQQIKKSQKK